MKMLITTLSVAALLAGPTLLQSANAAPAVDAARAQALRECNDASQRYPEYLWGDTEIYQYRACMAEHGQQE
jgi:hypothetical protein